VGGTASSYSGFFFRTYFLKKEGRQKRKKEGREALLCAKKTRRHMICTPAPFRKKKERKKGYATRCKHESLTSGLPHRILYLFMSRREGKEGRVAKENTLVNSLQNLPLFNFAGTGGKRRKKEKKKHRQKQI